MLGPCWEHVRVFLSDFLQAVCQRCVGGVPGLCWGCVMVLLGVGFCGGHVEVCWGHAGTVLGVCECVSE